MLRQALAAPEDIGSVGLDAGGVDLQGADKGLCQLRGAAGGQGEDDARLPALSDGGGQLR